MRSVGVREFRDHATKLIGAGETLVIERHGEPVGFFVPIIAKGPTRRGAGARATGRSGSPKCSRETGLTEDELVSEIVGDGGRDWSIQMQSARVSDDPSEHLVRTTARWAREPDEARR